MNPCLDLRKKWRSIGDWFLPPSAARSNQGSGFQRPATFRTGVLPAVEVASGVQRRLAKDRNAEAVFQI